MFDSLKKLLRGTGPAPSATTASAAGVLRKSGNAFLTDGKLEQAAQCYRPAQRDALVLDVAQALAAAQASTT